MIVAIEKTHKSEPFTSMTIKMVTEFFKQFNEENLKESLEEKFIGQMKSKFNDRVSGIRS